MGTVSERILLVEGPDDKHVIKHIRDRHPELTDFEIRDAGGLDSLLDAIEPEIKAKGRRSVGFLVDANSDFDDRWRSLADRLRTLEIQPPPILENKGCVIPGRPRVGLWLMPDNRNPGELEDFVQTLVPDDDPVWPLATGYINGIPPEHRKFNENKMMRAKIHAWLAVRKEPRQMGSAIRIGELSVDGEHVLRLVAWLRDLFGPEQRPG